MSIQKSLTWILVPNNFEPNIENDENIRMKRQSHHTL